MVLTSNGGRVLWYMALEENRNQVEGFSVIFKNMEMTNNFKA